MKSDEELVEEIKQGDDEAFRTLMSRYMRHIFNFVHQYVRIREEAEDVTQDAFFKSWRHIKKFDGSMKFKPWLFTIARNTAYDYIKRKRAISFSDMNPTDDDTDFSETVVDDEPLPSEIFARKELTTQLEEVMEMLNPDHRAVLLMHYREDMTFEEIAQIMHRPMNTVKSWHRRSLKRIKDELLHQNIR